MNILSNQLVNLGWLYQINIVLGDAQLHEGSLSHWECWLQYNKKNGPQTYHCCLCIFGSMRSHLLFGGHLRYGTAVWTLCRTHHQLDCDSAHSRSFPLYHSYCTGSSRPVSRLQCQCCSWDCSACTQCHRDQSHIGNLREKVKHKLECKIKLSQ